MLDFAGLLLLGYPAGVKEQNFFFVLLLLLQFAANLAMAATSASSSSAATDAETLRRNRILSSKLYLDVPPSKVVFSSSQEINMPSHLFLLI